MKSIFKLFALAIMASGIISCKKNEFESKPLASLSVINAVIGGGDVKLNMNYGDSAKPYNAKTFGLNVDDKTLRMYSTLDSTKPYYLQQQELNAGGFYSMFLFGNPPSVETIFMEDNPPHYSDSAIGIRVVNLASGSGALNITTAADPTTNILENIAYKDLTDFVKIALPFNVSPESVTFDIRNAQTGDILATYALPEFEDFNYPGISIMQQRFKGITLVVKGIAGTVDGPNAFGVFPCVTSY